ncbi:MAG: GMC oxidoreductase [Herbaspirillum sp.]|uniref:GMC oxidoreductase n=1 Tax=Herbaspirillum huttiense TaxID=863372 RepID=UPI0031DD6491
MSLRVAVVGSGPSGSSAAKVLMDAGISVDMFDVGVDAASAASAEPVHKKEGLIPHKTLFGSSYMYRRQDGLALQVSDNVSFDTSHAKGGLSSVWGATVGATTAHDIADWPVKIEDLSHHLSQVFEDMRLSARADMLDSIYPITLHGTELPYENRQSAHILRKVAENSTALLADELMVGKAKLAIDSTPGSPTACVLCGECMTGCTRGAIFNAWDKVALLKKRPQFRYLEGNIVHQFEERDDGVDLIFSPLQGGDRQRAGYDAVILAAGCIDSTKIADASLGWTGYEYKILDSQKFYFPVWVGRGGHSPIDESISLAHLYVQSFDSNKNIIQGQLYPGKLIAQTILEHLLGRVGKMFGKLISPFLNRCFVGVAYFSSTVSGRIGIRFEEGNKMVVSGTDNVRSTTEFDTFARKLRKHAKRTGFTAPFGLKMRSKLGHSQHFGGTIPMKANPARYESDSLGRPFGCQKVFIVDSTVLPSIPATPTTGLVMANAARIATWISANLRSH